MLIPFFNACSVCAAQDLSPGDVAFTKQPWGIGPRDDTWETRKFSFVRAKDMLARIG